MEKLIQAARDIIGAMNMEGDCPCCMSDLKNGEQHIHDFNGGMCPYEALTQALQIDCAHDAKYFVFKMDLAANPIPSNEPVFVLRGQDRYAAITLRDYAINRWRSNSAVVADREAWDKVIAIAQAMDAWPFHKEPD